MNNNVSNIDLPKSWQIQLKKGSQHDLISKPLNFIEVELQKGKKISPLPNEIFNAFKYCSFKNTKVVIFGQDPYFQENVANGLAFSGKKNSTIPASLKNIYKEVKDDIGYLINQDSCLENWAKQGVLLLNSALTVEVSKPGSHSNIGWNKLIKIVISALNKKKNIVFILWGSHAQKYTTLINSSDNYILKSSHPSPLSAYRGFFGCKHFSKCNNYLKKNNIEQINW